MKKQVKWCFQTMALVLLLVPYVMVADGCTSSCASSCSTSCTTSSSCNSNNDCNDCCDVTKSGTFFRARPLAQDDVLKLAIHNYDFFRRSYDDADECPAVMWTGSVFYYHSTKQKKLAEYFLPNCKDCISVKPTDSPDVNSLWLCPVERPNVGMDCDQNDPRMFDSCFCLRPQRKAVGVAIGGWVDLEKMFDCEFFCDWFARFFLPINHVQYRLNPSEEVNTYGLVENCQTVTQALTNNEHDFGQIYCRAKTKTSLDDISFQMGWNFLYDDCQRLGLYGALYIPTGKRSHAEYLFEPTLGSGGHVGLGGGITGDYILWDEEDTSLTFMIDARYAYFLKNDEMRSFDLTQNGQWSRYLLAAKERDPQTPLPAINFLTRCVEVKPKGSVDAWFAMHYDYCNYSIELGYDFWWRQREEICIPECPAINVGIYDITQPCLGSTGTPTTSSDATICEIEFSDTNPVPARDTAFTKITLDDLNVCSAEVPVAMTSKVYLAFSHCYECGCGAMGSVGIAGAYEFSHRRSALSQGSIWLLGNIEF